MVAQLSSVVVKSLLGRIGVNEDGQGASVDGQPRNEGAELGRRKKIDLEHGHGMWTNWLLPKSINSQFRDWISVSIRSVLVD